MDLQIITPTACDWDGDGDMDLIVGDEDGRVALVEHTGIVEDGVPVFHQPVYFRQQADTLKFGALATPFAFDWDGDLDPDIVFNSIWSQIGIPKSDKGKLFRISPATGVRESPPRRYWWQTESNAALTQWSSPTEVANGIQHQDLRWPCWNPVLFQPPGDSPTLLFFKAGPDYRQWWGEMMVSYDRGRTFHDRRRLPEQIDGPVRCKPILLPDGETLLAGSSTEYDGWRVHFEKVKLMGGQPAGTWKRIGPINAKEEFNAIQPTFLRHPGGKLQVLCRTQESVISTSFSEDGGETWSKMEAIDLPNPNSGIEAATLKDGRHLLIYNHLGAAKTGWGRRGMLNLAISTDGLEWRKVGVLEKEEKGEFSYPAIIQTEDGLVHMTYTWRRERIKHAVVDPEKIEPGEKLSLELWEKE